MIYIVSTPIGNLEDITLRALRILKEVDYIAAEDTRHVKRLLDKYEIKTKTLSYHSYSSPAKVERILDHIKEGKTIALVSDAGTPGISDPAYTLTQRAIEENIPLVPIPGPSSLLAAITASGKRMNQFLYIGFLPLKKGRQKLLAELAQETRTIILFESPHRIIKTLNQLAEHFTPDHPIAICRELTKLHEEIRREPIADAIEHFTTTKPRGEFVLVI